MEYKTIKKNKLPMNDIQNIDKSPKYYGEQKKGDIIVQTI